MKKNVAFLLISILILGCISSKKPLKELNTSLKSLIQPQSQWSNYSMYVLKNRKKAFKELNLNLNSNDEVAIIEEFDPFLDSKILSKIYYFGKKNLLTMK